MPAQRNRNVNVDTFMRSNVNIGQIDLENPKQRVSSLSSYFSHDSDDGKYELFGIRRFARTYFTGTGKRSKIYNTKEPKKFPAIDERGIGNLNGLGSYEPLPVTFRRSRGTERNSRQDDIFADHNNNDFMLTTKDKNFDFDLEANAGLYKSLSTMSTTDRDTILNKQSFPLNIGEYRDWDTTNQSNSIIFEIIPQNTGTGSILSQVCGGPLARIREYKDESSNQLEKLELSFFTSEAAIAFMKYGSTNIFKVNGIHLTPTWLRDKDFAFLEDISSHIYSGVCRCLVLKKYLPSNSNRAKSYDVPRDSLLDNLDLSELKKDFEEFGDIFDISPIVSRKLCVSINFYSVESSIKAMIDYEDPNTYFHKKYYKTWAAWYGKDITDRPCIQP